MPRAQNAIARVNAGFLFKMCTINTETIRKATIVYGNINPRFIHARKTEDFLKNKKLYSNTTLQQALRILSDELLTEGYPEETRKAKKKIALGLFYKVCRYLYTTVNDFYTTLLFKKKLFSHNNLYSR